MRADERDAGTLSVMVAVMALPIFALAGLVIDAGRALHARAQALSWAEEAARAGAQGVDPRALVLDDNAVRSRVLAFCNEATTANNVQGHAVLSFPGGCLPSIAGGCVTMKAQVTIQTGFLGLVGVDSLSETRSASAQADVGVDQGDAVAVAGGC